MSGVAIGVVILGPHEFDTLTDLCVRCHASMLAWKNGTALECATVDPHDWWNGACKRCHADYQSFVDGTSPRCKSVVRSMAADEFATIHRRLKEIEAERGAVHEASVAWTKPRLREPTAQEIALEDGYWLHSWRTV